jgi:cytochrome b subunit of formate dehydrogenase
MKITLVNRAMIKRRSDSEIKRYGKIVVLEHWLMMIFLVPLAITGLFGVRDWFIHEFHIFGAENFLPTPEFATDFHLYAAFGLVIVGAIHLVVHAGQKEKPILPKNTNVELKSALYSLMYLVFLTKRQERGSGGKYKKSQRIIYAFTIYVLGLAAITGFLFWAGILVEQMLVAHIIAGILVLLVGVHRIALMIRRHDKVAIRCVGFTGTMPEWYVRKNHKVWYEKMVGREVVDTQKPVKPKPGSKGPEKEDNLDEEIDNVTKMIGGENPTPSES